MISPDATGDIGDDSGPKIIDPVVTNQDSMIKCAPCRINMISINSVHAMMRSTALNRKKRKRLSGFIDI